MRIALIGSSPDHGLLYHPTRLAIQLKKQGHDVHVLTAGHRAQSRELRPSLRHERIPVHICKSLENAGLGGMAYSSSDIRAVLQDVKPAVVHTYGAVSLWQCSHGWDAPPSVAMIEAMGHNLKVRWPERFGALILNAHASRVIALCTSERDRLVAGGVDERKIRIIYNHLDCADVLHFAKGADRNQLLHAHRLPSSKKFLGYFASLQPRKRQDLVLRAFAKTADRFPEWQLVIAGGGAERDRLEKLTAELQLGERVHFLGHLATDRSLPLLSVMDAVVHCSNAETFGYSMIEPLLLGLPFLTTRVAIGHELARDGVAAVIPPNELEPLVSGLNRLLSSDPELLENAKKGPEYVLQNFDVAAVASKLVDVYSDLSRG